jgi:predicted methyltransferase
MTLVVLSHFQAKALLHAREQHERAVTSSFDLGMTELEIQLDATGAWLPDGSCLAWAKVQQICDDESHCFRLGSGDLEPIRGFSEETQRTHQLYPTQSAPALLLSGFTMHRIRDTTPEQGAHDMVKALGPIRGRVLDTATGLGYVAIEAARSADEVVTIELDPVAQEMARLNPWSQALFRNDKIQQLIGDSAQLILDQPADSFFCILHDPPAINLAGDLYAESFYRALHRVLQKSGRLFHYIGDPQSSSGSRVTKGVKQRLSEAGFSKVVPKPEAFGVLAYK